MKFTPVNDWKWSYNGSKLGLNLIADNGVNYAFNTHYSTQDLHEDGPEHGQQFCIEDATLLTDYQEGLSKLIKNDGGCLDLGINAVACARFVKPSIPSSRYFLPFGGKDLVKRGDVVSLYTKEGNVGDCIVLNECDGDNLSRLMLLNPKLTVNDGRSYVLGSMLRVRQDYVCPFRSITGIKSVRYA